MPTLGRDDEDGSMMAVSNLVSGRDKTGGEGLFGGNGSAGVIGERVGELI